MADNKPGTADDNGSSRWRDEHHANRAGLNRAVASARIQVSADRVLGLQTDPRILEFFGLGSESSDRESSDPDFDPVEDQSILGAAKQK